jgi:hypothetical protein
MLASSGRRDNYGCIIVWAITKNAPSHEVDRQTDIWTMGTNMQLRVSKKKGLSLCSTYAYARRINEGRSGSRWTFDVFH